MCNTIIFPTTRLFFPRVLLLVAMFFGLMMGGVGQTVTISGNTVFCEGDDLMLGSAIGGEDCTAENYFWQIWDGQDWININTAIPEYAEFNGVQTGTLTHPSVNEDLNGYQIRLFVGTILCEGASESNVESNALTLSVTNPPPPMPTASPSTTVCAGTVVTLSVENDGLGGTFEWYLEGGGYINNGNSILVTPQVESTYIVRREINNCYSTSKSIMITVTPHSPIVNITADPLIPCEGQEVILTASGGSDNTIHWYDSPNGGGQLLGTGNQLFIESATATTFYARRENDDCGDPTNDKEFTLSTQDPPVASIDALPQALCLEDNFVSFDFLANTSGNEPTVDYLWRFLFADSILYESMNSESAVTVNYNQEGDAVAMLIVKNSACADTVLHSFPIVDKPKLFIGTTEINTSGQEVFEVAANTNANLMLTSVPDGATFEWSFTLTNGRIEGSPGSGQGPLINEKWELPDGEESAELEGSIKVSLGSCTETYIIKVILQPLLFVPNVITVNGDGENECWAINLLEDSSFTEQDFNIELYSRTGICVRGCSESFTVADAILWCGEGCGAGAYFYRITGPEGYEKLGSLTIVK